MYTPSLIYLNKDALHFPHPVIFFKEGCGDPYDHSLELVTEMAIDTGSKELMPLNISRTCAKEIVVSIY